MSIIEKLEVFIDGKRVDTHFPEAVEILDRLSAQPQVIDLTMDEPAPFNPITGPVVCPLSFKEQNRIRLEKMFDAVTVMREHLEPKVYELRDKLFKAELRHSVVHRHELLYKTRGEEAKDNLRKRRAEAQLGRLAAAKKLKEEPEDRRNMATLYLLLREHLGVPAKRKRNMTKEEKNEDRVARRRVTPLA